jgi:hypothetical protein
VDGFWVVVWGVAKLFSVASVCRASTMCGCRGYWGLGYEFGGEGCAFVAGWGVRFRVLGVKVRVLGVRVQVLRFGLGVRVRGLGFGVWIWG